MRPESDSICLRLAARFHDTCRNPNVRQAVKLALDSGAAAGSWLATSILIHAEFSRGSSTLAWVAFAMTVNVAFKHTRQHYRLIGFMEIRALILSTVVMGLAAVACFAAQEFPGLPWTNHPEAVLAAGLITSMTWVTMRAAVVEYFRRRSLKRHPHRPTVDRRLTPRSGASHANELALRTLIVGAGQAGAQLCHELNTNPSLKSRVVGFIDDAIEKQGVRIHGIPVLGPTEMLPIYIKETKASQVILAMPRVPGSRIRDVARILQGQSVRVKTLPSMQTFLEKAVWKPELRDIAIEDLLRREPIQLSEDIIRKELTDSVVLITGAGGSIGSELARQVATFKPFRLVLLGRGENSLWETERELRWNHPELRLEVELCDIRNIRRLKNVFEAWRPQFVFHAAAHKHVPFLEKHPEEGIENNIFGTQNVLNAARAVGALKFVNISTDKSVNPTSVLGVTKHVAELLVLHAAEDEADSGQYVSVRFGNVLGSRGSVIPLFHEQILHGGPITVTHPEMTRYFMTIPEASQLVLQAGMLGHSGKVFVLDMGEPVRIIDLATDMARLSGLTPGFDIDIQFSGIRPGEKLFEELFTDQEQGASTVHTKVFEALQKPKNRAVLDRLLRDLRDAVELPDGVRQRAIVHGFQELVPSYHPSPTGLGRYLEPPMQLEDAVGIHQWPSPPVVALHSPMPLAQLRSS